jgi:hypothetical protein
MMERVLELNKLLVLHYVLDYPESAEIETGATRSNINSYSLVLPDIE